MVSVTTKLHGMRGVDHGAEDRQQVIGLALGQRVLTLQRQQVDLRFQPLASAFMNFRRLFPHQKDREDHHQEAFKEDQTGDELTLEWERGLNQLI